MNYTRKCTIKWYKLKICTFKFKYWKKRMKFKIY